MNSLKQKTIFITGASRGIGREIALRCARDGANVVVTGKTSDPNPKLEGTIHSVSKEIEAAGGKALAIQLDVRDEAQVVAAIKRTVETFGGLDAMINNAGAISLTSTEATPMKRFDLMMSVNVRASFLCAQAALPCLKKSPNAHILSMSPPLSVDPKWFVGHAAYTVSKFGMTMCALAMAKEFSTHGIAVNTLWPRTTIHTAAVAMLMGDDGLKHSRKPTIVADAVQAILTTPSRELTGQMLIDEDFLRSRGVVNFDQYANAPGEKLYPDIYL